MSRLPTDMDWLPDSITAAMLTDAIHMYVVYKQYHPQTDVCVFNVRH